MALADYRLCDVCGGKAFYDSNLNYEFRDYEPSEEAHVDGELANYRLDYLGDWAVICLTCRQTHRCVVVPR